MSSQPRILVLGYGNPGRQDDGLGPAAAEAIERWNLPGVDVESSYLLNIEDAATAAEHDVILFVDAAAEGPEPFDLRPVEPGATMAFTSHIVQPATILAICRQCYGRTPRAWLLAIRGYDFELMEGLTERASTNLEKALAQVRCWLEQFRPLAA
jgi:hydrogenase maturation protease